MRTWVPPACCALFSDEESHCVVQVGLEPTNDLLASASQILGYVPPCPAVNVNCLVGFVLFCGICLFGFGFGKASKIEANYEPVRGHA